MPEGVYARPDVTAHGPGSGALSCWTELVGYVRRGAARFRRVPFANGTPDGRYADRQARRLHAAVALGAVKRFVFRSQSDQR